MDSADLADILGMVRSFVRDVVVPAEDEIEETDAIPARIREQAAAMGLFGFAIPEEYGYASPAFRSMFGTNNGIAGHVLLEGGTEEQRKKFLPRLEPLLVDGLRLGSPDKAAGEPAGGNTLPVGGDARHDRRVVPVGLLYDPASARRQVVANLWGVQPELAVVDDVEVGLVAGRDAPPV